MFRNFPAISIYCSFEFPYFALFFFFGNYYHIPLLKNLATFVKFDFDFMNIRQNLFDHRIFGQSMRCNKGADLADVQFFKS